MDFNNFILVLVSQNNFSHSTFKYSKMWKTSFALSGIRTHQVNGKITVQNMEVNCCWLNQVDSCPHAKVRVSTRVQYSAHYLFMIAINVKI